MTFAANVLNVIGVVFLSHAVYSAYEHSLLASRSTSSPVPSLPLDITLETLFSVLLLCIGVVLSSPDLKPIQWHVWAGRMEKSKEARLVTEVGVGGGNPYAALEERPGFWDVRGAQKAFGGWLRENGEKTN
nr:hypothetical protein B0A51_09666 [Rachicladosporium sp. CCFEE 5018]